MIKRPDEQAVDAEIARDQQFRSNVNKGVATAASLGTGVVAAGASARILPWLSQYIPTDLAIKGISKVSPKVADFLKRGQAAGLDIKDGIQYVKDMIFKDQEKESPESGKTPQKNKNIIEQYSPELHQFLSEKIKGGEDPIRTAAAAYLSKDKNFKDIIHKIQKDHKVNWEDLVQTVYSTENQSPGKSQAALHDQVPKSETPGFTQKSATNWDEIASKLQSLLNS